MYQSILLPLLALSVRVSCKEPTVLYVGGLFELTESWYSGYTPFFVTIIQHAFEEIHERDDILPDFRFEMIVKDTKVCIFWNSIAHLHN